MCIKSRLYRPKPLLMAGVDFYNITLCAAVVTLRGRTEKWFSRHEGEYITLVIFLFHIFFLLCVPYLRRSQSFVAAIERSTNRTRTTWTYDSSPLYFATVSNHKRNESIKSCYLLLSRVTRYTCIVYINNHRTFLYIIYRYI